MSGNAHEWIDACNTADQCALMGGGVGGHSAADMRCDAVVAMPLDVSGDDEAVSWGRETGFRCCGL
jgi:hypothetical protein